MKLNYIGLCAGLIALSTLQNVNAQTLSASNKIERIESSVHKVMSTFQVPGIAVAIIKDNEVVLSKGFGVLKYGSKAPVRGKLKLLILFQSFNYPMPMLRVSLQSSTCSHITVV